MSTSEEKKLAFVSFCVEEYKAKMGCSGQKVIDFFNRYGVKIGRAHV